MADDGYNGTTVSWASADQGELLSCGYTENAAKVQTSGAGATNKEYVAGTPDFTFTWSIPGGTTISVGDTGALSVSWNDGGSTSFTNASVVDVSIDGSEDSPITSSITVVPTASA